jgi:hypothetical protein
MDLAIVASEQRPEILSQKDGARTGIYCVGRVVFSGHINNVVGSLPGDRLPCADQRLRIDLFVQRN